MMQNIVGFLKKYKKRFIIGGSIVLIIILLIAFGKRGDTGFVTATASVQTVTEQVEVAGTVESNDLANLGFEVSGRVASVPVKVGDIVNQGDVLVRLDTSTLNADLLDAQAAVSIARANLDNDEVTVVDVTQQQDVLVESARRKLLSSDLEAVPQSNAVSLDAPIISGTYRGGEGEYKIRILRSEVNASNYFVRIFGLEEGEYELKTNKSTPLGNLGLYIELPGELSDYRETIWTLAIPNTRSASYLTNLNAYEQAVENRTVAIRSAESSLSQGNRMTSVAEANLQKAQAQVDRIRSEINKRTIRAPFAGTVSAMRVSPGEIASGGSGVVTVVSNNKFEIVLDVPEIDVSKLEIDNPVTIQLDAFGQRETWEGVIIAISQAENTVDGVPVYETRVAFAGEDERIRSGMSATVSVITETRKDVVAIPLEFIQRDENGTFVYIIIDDDETTERRDIAVGLRGSNGIVEIIDGLVDGDIIANQSSA